MVQQVIADDDRHSFRDFKQWIQTRDSGSRMIFLSGLVGIIGGLAAVVFRYLIAFVFYLLHSLPKSTLPEIFVTIAAPTIGGLVVGYLVHRFADEARGTGVPQIIEVVNRHHSEIRKRVPFVKMLASSITLGSGGSAGREGPIAQIGGSFGNIMGQVFELRNEEIKDLTIGGVSSAIAASFNAPLGGILFGLEVIRRDNRAPNFLPLITATVIGTAVGQFFLGNSPSFIFPSNLTINSVANLPFLVITGVLIGGFSVIWIKGLFEMQIRIENISLHPILLTGLGGFLVGVIEVWFPQVAGYESGSTEAINLAFDNQIVLELAFVLLLLKFLATSLTISTGGSGGIFAPTLFMGVMTGIFLGNVFSFLGIFNFNIALYAVLGMAALFAGSMRAPLTGVIMTAEMVNDFRILFPLLVVVLSSWLVSRAIIDKDIYIYRMLANGIRFQREFDVLDETLVKTAMVPLERIDTLAPKDRIEEFLYLMKTTGHTGFPVVDEGRVVGVVTEHDVTHAMESHDIRDWVIQDICTKKVVACLPSTPISILMQKMQNRGINRFPVIDNHTDKLLVGWITRSDVIKYYLREKQIQVQEKVERDMFEEIGEE